MFPPESVSETQLPAQRPGLFRNTAQVLVLFVLAWFGGWLGHACTDYSTMYYPSDTRIRAEDSLVMREILDSNGLYSLVVDSVCIGSYGYVSEINLSRQGMASFHFPDIAVNLIRLRRVDLSRNNLEEAPGNAWVLPALQELVLDSNRLSALPDTFFSESANLAGGLTLLSLSHNRFDSIPYRIRNLRALRKINLNSNLLRDLPLEIDSLPHLEENNSRAGRFGLDVAFNRICNPAPGLADMLDRHARLDWRMTQVCPAVDP